MPSASSDTSSESSSESSESSEDSSGEESSSSSSSSSQHSEEGSSDSSGESSESSGGSIYFTENPIYLTNPLAGDFTAFNAAFVNTFPRQVAYIEFQETGAAGMDVASGTVGEDPGLFFEMKNTTPGSVDLQALLRGPETGVGVPTTNFTVTFKDKDEQIITTASVGVQMQQTLFEAVKPAIDQFDLGVNFYQDITTTFTQKAKGEGFPTVAVTEISAGISAEIQYNLGAQVLKPELTATIAAGSNNSVKVGGSAKFSVTLFRVGSVQFNLTGDYKATFQTGQGVYSTMGAGFEATNVNYDARSLRTQLKSFFIKAESSVPPPLTGSAIFQNSGVRLGLRVDF